MQTATVVNKHYADWHPQITFCNMQVKITLRYVNFTEQMAELHQLRGKLLRDCGEELKEWAVCKNRLSGQYEVYLRTTDMLLLWKLKSQDDVLCLFTAIECHDLAIL
jgi:hypothetical protein